MRVAAFALAFLATGPSVAAQTVADLGWMAGNWVESRADGRVTEEIWLPPRGGMMIGMSRSGKGDKVGLYEFVRIGTGPDGKPSFDAQPGGQPPDSFPLVALGAQSVTFENPAHDHPTRIRYWREGERLMAEIEGKDGAGRMRWSYRPAP